LVYNKAMDAKQVKELTGLTYGQLNYLVDQVDALKREKTQGKARDFTFRDLVYLKVASLMRADGMSLPVINKGITLLNRTWVNSENPSAAGSLLRADENDKKVVWYWGPMTVEEVFDTNTSGERITEQITHIPGVMYNVAYIASELAKGDQLELDLMSEVEAVN